MSHGGIIVEQTQAARAKGKPGIEKCELTCCGAANQENISGRWTGIYTHAYMPNNVRTYICPPIDVLV